jgi:hypothetical protein
MPSCRVTNNTPQPLNICLKQVTALHFENGVSQVIQIYSRKISAEKSEGDGDYKLSGNG